MWARPPLGILGQHHDRSGSRGLPGRLLGGTPGPRCLAKPAKILTPPPRPPCLEGESSPSRFRQAFDFQLTSEDMQSLEGLNRNWRYFPETRRVARPSSLSLGGPAGGGGRGSASSLGGRPPLPLLRGKLLDTVCPSESLRGRLSSSPA